MTATFDSIRHWLTSPRAEGCSHMIVVCDTFSYDDYPVYVDANEDIQKMLAKYRTGMNRIVEVYDLSKDLDSQLSQKRAYNI